MISREDAQVDREFASKILLVALAAQAVSLWFITSAMVRVTTFPADSLYFARQLPFTYWWGLATSLLLVLSTGLVSKRINRALIEIPALFLLSLYAIGLPSFVYENPRILDSYAHMSNVLLILTSHGWVDSTDWYVRQFPGAYTYLAQIIAIGGVSPFDLMKYYVVGCSLVMILFIYTLVRVFNPSYAGRMTALSIGGFWFQLHISPQSLELIPYLGLVYVFWRVAVDKEHQTRWTILGTGTIPVFVLSHPETAAVVVLGLSMLIFLARIGLILSWLRSHVRLLGLPTLSKMLPESGTIGSRTTFHYFLFLIVLVVSMIVWWFTFAAEARVQILTIAQSAIHSALAGRTKPPATLPTTPAYSYELAIGLEQAVSVVIWMLGLVFFILARGRLRARDYPIWGLFFAAVATIPLTFEVRADMLQRSYLFSLLPGIVFFGGMMSQRHFFQIGRRSLYVSFKVVFILAIITFAVLTPLTRNGVDPYEYIPSSSLQASSVAAVLTSHSNSVLFLYNGEYAWRYYAALDGDPVAIRDEQADMIGMAGGFTKPNSTVTVAGTIYIIPFTRADRESHYIVMSDFYENLYTLRFGQGSVYYVDQKASFENQVALRFDLVYTTGTDRIYLNTDPVANT